MPPAPENHIAHLRIMSPVMVVFFAYYTVSTWGEPLNTALAVFSLSLNVFTAAWSWSTPQTTRKKS